MPNSDEIHLPSFETIPPDFSLGSVFFVGTATVLLRYAGFTILTDPNFLHAGDLVYLGYGLTSERLTHPALNIEDLPPVDFCILSHYHGDHFDRIAEEKLSKALTIVTTKEAARALSGKGFTAPRALDTWKSVTLEKDGARVKITSMPGRHGPPVVARLLPEVMGSLLEFQPGEGGTALRLYITGDTLVFDGLKEIPKKFPEIDLALFHLGGTRIMGMLLTMDADQGVEAIRIIQPRRVIPIHYNDYTVFKSPLEDFKKSAADAGFEDRVIYLGHGQLYNFEVPESRTRRAA
ncbi:MAG: MBL fold metallo-hydrolase [Candidatus Manganitrophus sp.]|nr:MBL fold metallo-hydrolase [Candidatus Manganitrophus sp.]MDC4225185.1 MBL fold metallo-hydrolase [Candidatus Manganitrophus sp.]WDT69370.1 MAG: MBL fold metallo-hydrolase [Candidatus Manganitrophus sp.]WDT79045.1 MAG: MBL fold metallo-hydrolase [Candidatus Manganitrophus sp.]